MLVRILLEVSSQNHPGGINVFSSKLTKNNGLMIKSVAHLWNLTRSHQVAVGKCSIKITLGKTNALNPFRK